MPACQPSPAPASREALLAWYRPRRRAYPWRDTADPYAVLVSEIMLQQTQAARVVPAYRSFLRRFPSVGSLARASRGDVVRAWDGLGYNRRALALSETARAIVRDHGGEVPRDPDALRRLPGVGPYTAAAVASLAYGVPVAAVDTNVRRVVARALGGVEPERLDPASIRAIAQAWLDRDVPGGWNQALMDLGRGICRPRPRCEICPLVRGCRFAATGAVTGPVPAPPRPEAFEGSNRQVRGAVVGVLRRAPWRSIAALARETGHPAERIARAVGELARDGLVRAGPAALAGRRRGRVRLAD